LSLSSLSLSLLSKLSTLLSLLPSLTTSVEVLPCTGYVDAGCVADLVRGGCDPAAAVAIAAALGLAAARAAAELMAYTVSLLSLPVPAQDASAIGAKGSSGKGDATSEGCSKNESGRGNVSANNGDAGAMSNRRWKRIKLQQQTAMQSTAAVAAATADSSGAIESGIACSGQKWQRSSLLEEEVVQHAMQVQLHQHSMDFSVLGGGTKLFKLNHCHYKKLCLLAAVSCGGSVSGDPHQRTGAGAVRISESDFNKLVYCMLSRYHLVLGHGFQMTLGKQAFNVLRVV
jgi:hypothetical protein